MCSMSELLTHEIDLHHQMSLVTGPVWGEQWQFINIIMICLYGDISDAIVDIHPVQWLTQQEFRFLDRNPIQIKIKYAQLLKSFIPLHYYCYFPWLQIHPCISDLFDDLCKLTMNVDLILIETLCGPPGSGRNCFAGKQICK